jgi:CRISPR type I-E-associated protein CasB/Cse2
MIEAKRVVQDLLRMQSNKAAMAAFKSCLSPARAYRAWSYIAQLKWCDIQDDRMRTIVQHIAAFFARHPKHALGTCFGDSLRQMAFRRTQQNAIEVNERYLKRILSSRDYQSLCPRLAFVLHMIKSTDVPVDYERLLSDIVSWDEDTGIRWASAYYSKGDEDVSDKNIG